MASVLIIGGGFAGCCAAHMLHRKGHDIDLIESTDLLGGGVRTFFYGGHPYTVGPRHFLTENEDWFRYLADLIPMHSCGNEHENLTYVEPDQKFYTYPPHIDDINTMPERDEIHAHINSVSSIFFNLETLKSSGLLNLVNLYIANLQKNILRRCGCWNLIPNLTAKSSTKASTRI